MNESVHDDFARLSAAIRESRTQRMLAVAYCREARHHLSFQAHHLAAAELAAATERARALLRPKTPADAKRDA